MRRERAALALMCEFHRIDVVGRPTRLLSDDENLILRDVRCAKRDRVSIAGAPAITEPEGIML
jgi:hypothetical protein